MNKRIPCISALAIFFVILFAAGNSYAAIPITAGAHGSSAENTVAPEAAAKDVSTHHLRLLERLPLVKALCEQRHYSMYERNNNNKYGWLSLISGGVSLILLSIFSSATAVAVTATGGIVALMIGIGITSVVAIVCGAIGIKRDRKRALAIIGMIIGINCLVEMGIFYTLAFLMSAGM